MASDLLFDNWTLQCAGAVLSRGLNGGEASELVLAEDRTHFSYARRSEDVVNVRSLFQTLDSIVFADRLRVDQDGAFTWADVPDLVRLQEDGFIVPRAFQAIREQWLPARNRFVEELCVGKEMRALHARNVQQYRLTQQNEDPFFGQLVWGGAGMLARAHVMGLPYLAHPLRESWFRRVDCLFGPSTAQERLRQFVGAERVRVLQRTDATGFLARINLPPVATLAALEASDLAGVLTVAQQLRTEYAPLRKWLGEFQAAMEADDTSDLLAKEKVLQSVGRHIAACCSAFPLGDTTLQIGTSWLKTTLKAGDPINSVRNQFGARAMLNRLILAPAGRDVLRKLARFCGEEHSARGLEFQRAFMLETRGAEPAEPGP